MKGYKVKNIIGFNDREIANQFIINVNDSKKGIHKTLFQSYDSTVVEIDRVSQTVTLGYYYDYSRTTAKYVRLFLEQECLGTFGSINGVRKKLKDNTPLRNGYRLVYDEEME